MGSNGLITSQKKQICLGESFTMILETFSIKFAFRYLFNHVDLLVFFIIKT